MTYNVDFLVASLIFMAVLWFHFRNMPAITSLNRSVFTIFLWVGIWDIILDIITSYIIDLHNPSLNDVNLGLLTIFYVLQACVVLCLMAYGISLRSISKEKMLKEIKLWSIPTILLVIAIFANMKMDFLFYFDEQGNYIHGSLYYLMYIYALVYSACLCIMNIVKSKELTKERSQVIWEFLIICLLCVSIQAINPLLSLSGFGIGLGLAVLLFTLNNPYTQTDNLTGILDQASFLTTIEDRIYREKQFHIISINLVQLAQLNAIYGTKNGDKSILYLVSGMKKLTKAPIFRISGKRFVILFSDDMNFKKVLQEINPVMNQIMDFSGEQIQMNAFVAAIQNAQQLGSADKVAGYIDYLYNQNKDLKESKIIYSTAESIQGFEYQQKVEQYVFQAIEKNLFDVYFQPVYSLQKKDFVSLESLSRLYHPQLGYIPADLFITLAEKSGMVWQIDYLQFQNVCLFVNEHRELLERLESIKFNLSPVDILKEGFAQSMIDVIYEYNLPTSFFQFEITETAATIYTNEFMTAIRIFEKENIKICLDDFGSGYANLTSVMKLPFDAIKLDYTLLENITTDSHATLLYHGIVSLLKESKYKMIAEGVETKEEFELLKSWGVDMIQGDYFSKPLCREDLLKLLLKD